MKIKNITAHRLGPYYAPFTLQLEGRVTIITGANDTGKSSLLKALELALSEGSAEESFVNHDHLQESQVLASNDATIKIDAVIELTESVDIRDQQLAISKGDQAKLTRYVTQDVLKSETAIYLRQHGNITHLKLKLPAIVKVLNQADENLRDIIDLKNPLPLEKALLDTAFKAPFGFDRLAAMSALAFSRSIRDAQEVLNKLLERVMPNPGLIKFDLIPVEGDRSRLGILIRDRHDGITPFGVRGSGVRRMITLMAALITYHRGAHHKIVLLDEPENSLHPDAQHLLREFLYDLTKDGKTQVVYATHSSAMINPMRGEQVRVLVRAQVGATATTKLLSQSTERNFHGLRTSLGMSLADSLIFAPVAVITEGATEVGCLPKLMEKLQSRAELGSFEISKLLGLCSFMDGMGDSFEYLCRLAKQHGVRVVLFLDGDKRAKVEQLKMSELHPDVSIVFLPNQSEFEELVPLAVYLNALAELTGAEIPENAGEEINKWVAQISYRSKQAFSKKIEGWFRDNYSVAFPSKKVVMQKALELADVSAINVEPVRELLNSIQRSLASSSFA